VPVIIRVQDAGVFESKRAAPAFATGWKSRESLPAPVAEITDMAIAVQKITLSASRDIPFNKLVLSQGNVRRVKAGVSIEELAEDIVRRTLLQGLSVRPILDAEGQETGMFEVPAGGRRYRALELLVKQKRMAKTVLVPCVVRDPSTDISADEDSLAENVQRVALHPLDQFRAFQALRDKGLGEEEIAARFFVAPTVVKQRLRLAAVSGKLLDVYAEDGMTLEQLMAFTVTSDHARQEQVWEGLTRSHNREAYFIRRQLTEGAVRAADRRAQFVGAEAYEAAGGMVMRDLFEHDDGGWLQDPALLDRLLIEKLQAEAETLRAEGWKWVTVAADFPYGHAAGLRRLTGETVASTDEEDASLTALKAEHDALEAQYAEAEELPDEVDQRLGEIETAIAELEDRPVRYDPAEIARAGVFVSIDSEGALRIERGFVRPEDEAPVEPVAGGEAEGGGEAAVASTEGAMQRAVITIGGAPASSDPESAEEDDTIRPLSDRLVTELTAHRTLALRDALANDPHIAFQAVLHALCLQVFYRYAPDTCLEITAKHSGFSAQAPGLADTPSAKAIEARHAQWGRQLPETPADLWDALTAFDSDSQAALFAHCASLAVNVVKEPWNRRPGALAHGDLLAQAVNLDLAASGWHPTVDNYLGRVPKVRILQAVREAKGEQSAQLIDHLKKADMAKEAERLLEGTGWLPEPLRLADAESGTQATGQAETDAEVLPAFLSGEDEAGSEADAPQSHAIAAE
jgi:ParB family chromosome partitioning protein